MGSIEIEEPKVRDVIYFPSLLEPCWRAERALFAAVREACAHGVSPRAR